MAHAIKLGGGCLTETAPEPRQVRERGKVSRWNLFLRSTRDVRALFPLRFFVSHGREFDVKKEVAMGRKKKSGRCVNLYGLRLEGRDESRISRVARRDRLGRQGQRDTTRRLPLSMVQAIARRRKGDADAKRNGNCNCAKEVATYQRRSSSRIRKSPWE